MVRRSVCPLVAAVLITLTTAPGASAGPTTPVNVSMRRSSQVEAAVAVNPLDPNDVVVASNVEFGFGIFVGVSHDGGATWSRDVIGDFDRFGEACCDPTITWDASGTLFLGWIGYEDRPVPTVLTIVMSVNGGDDWTTYDHVTPPAPAMIRAQPTAAAQPFPMRGVRARDVEEGRGGAIDQPTITSGHGTLWAIWSQDGWLQAAGAKVRGLGDVGRFKPVEDVPKSHACTFGDIAVGPDGQVLQVCQRNKPQTSPPTSAFRMNVDADGLGAGGFDPGRVVARSNVSLFEAIPAQRERTIDAEAGLAWDTTGGPYDGRLYFMYTDETPDQSNDTNVLVRISDDGGATWTPPGVVTAAPLSQFLPRIALDPTTGHVAVGWHDASLDLGRGRYDTDGKRNTDAMYFMAFSGDGGVTWSAPSAVSEGASNAAAAGAQDIDFGDYTGLAFSDGAAHPAWADNSNSTGDNPDGTLHAFDVYSATVAG